MQKVTQSILTLAAVLAVSTQALAQEATPPALWGELPIQIIPHVNVRGVYDDNILKLSDNEESDIYIDASAGLSIAYAGSSLSALLSGFVSARRHDDFSDNDFETYGQALQLRYGTRDVIAVEARQAFRRVTDADTAGSEVAVGNVSPDSALDTATSQERDILQFGLRAARNITDKSEIDLGYRFDSVDYTSGNLDKITTQTVQVELGSQVTDKSSGLIVLRGGSQDNDNLDDSADFVSASLGIRTLGTDKLALRATGGFQVYNRADNDDSEESFVFDANAQLRVTDKLGLHAGGRNGIQLSPTLRGNASEFVTLYAGGRFQATHSVNLVLNASYREDEYLNPVLIDDILRDRTDKGTAVSLRANYTTPTDYLSLFAQAMFQTIDSPAGDYDQTVLSAGVRLQY